MRVWPPWQAMRVLQPGRPFARTCMQSDPADERADILAIGDDESAQAPSRMP